MLISKKTRIMLVVLLIAVFGQQARASHLFGGEFTYEYIGPSGITSEPFQYRITYKVYTGSLSIASNVEFRFYNKNGSPIITPLLHPTSGTSLSNPLGPSSTNGPLRLPIPPSCAIPNLPNIWLLTYDFKVNLPISFSSYYATASVYARNNDITNLLNPGSTSLFTYTEISGPLLPSKSPVFSDTAVVVMFSGDTTSIINSAFDADGDKLIYVFNNPFDEYNYTTFIPSTTIPARIPYTNSSFSVSNPFGTGGYAKLNASTGLATYFIPTAGNYVVSFQVQEWRNVNGTFVMIGSTIRDIQLVVRNTPLSTNARPDFTHNGPKVVTITEGEAIPPINFTFTDPNAGQLLTITANSPLLDGPGNKNASFSGQTNNPAKLTNVPIGTMAIFNYTSACGQANTYPLDITVSDNACPPGKKVESFQIVVLPYKGPGRIFGDTTVCSQSEYLYYVSGKAAANYQWKLQGGGTFVGNTNNDSIRIQWSTPGRYKLTAIETSTGNCSDSVSFFVNVRQGQTISVSPPQTICAGKNATLTATGATAFTWTDGVTSFSGSTITVSPLVSTTYTVTSPATAGGCEPRASVLVTVNPKPVIQPGPNRSICLGDQTVLSASGANTYRWFNGTTSLFGNNLTVFPTVTTTYTVTGTTVAGCLDTAVVTITVNPLPTPTLNLDNTYCRNSPPVGLPAGQGIVSTVNGTIQTSFDPATLGPGVHTVEVSETNANGCLGSVSKVVTILPGPTISQIKGPAFICPENLSNLLYYVVSTPGQTFNWTVTGGTMVNSGSTNDSIWVNFNSSATKEIKVTPISATGCAGSPLILPVLLDPAALQLNVASTTFSDDKSIEINLQMPGNQANTRSVEIYRREPGGTFAKIGSIANTTTTFTDNSVQTSAKSYEYRLESQNECGTILKSNIHRTMLLQVSVSEEKHEAYLRWNSYQGWAVKHYEIFAQADKGGFELLRTVSAGDSVITLTNISGRGFDQCFRIKAVSPDNRVSWSNISCGRFENPLAFYNIITPNNDQFNDFFVVENIHLYPGNELLIYNRWGTEVYRKSNYDNTWDGKNLSDGVYYYLMRLHDGRTFKGWVEVVH